MEQPTQFRISLSGFHREDVVHYIEYLNNKHAAQISQLKTEIEQLRKKQAHTAPDEDLAQELLNAQAECNALRSRVEELEQKLQQSEHAKSTQSSVDSDLRAIISGSTGNLANSAAMLEQSNETIAAIADSLVTGLNTLQSTMNDSRKAMLDACNSLENLNK